MPVINEPVYCICRKPDDGLWMIGCDGCSEWFHGHCVGITETEGQLAEQYFCGKCTSEGRGRTLWHMKCKLQNCLNPARIEASERFCCDEHGIEFFQSLVPESLIEPCLLKTLVLSADGSVGRFRELGNDPVHRLRTDTEFLAHARSEEADRLVQIKHELEKQYIELRCIGKRNEFVTRCVERQRHARELRKSTEKPKKEICGYDLRLNMQNYELDAVIDKLIATVDESGQSLIDAVTLEPTSSQASISGQNGSNEADTSICIAEKRKCIKHAAWQAIKSEEVALDRGRCERRIRQLQSDADTTRDAIQMRYLIRLQSADVQCVPLTAEMINASTEFQA